MQGYVAAEYMDDERAILARHFTSVDGPASVLVNLPEGTKAALFARYSRTAKPLMRVFLDEFYREDSAGASQHGVGIERASDLFSRVLSDYGDDSVAQLAGIHISCEQVSNLLTKVLERGRLMGYLEQSTRYVFYGDKPGQRYRYYRDPELLSGPHADVYLAAMDGLFDAYGQVYESVKSMLEAPIAADDKAGRGAARAAALDVARGLLPAGTISNVGIFGSPQAYEQLVLRMRADALPEARAYGELILVELMKVIPDFLTRLQRPERGGVWVDYLRERAEALQSAARNFDRTRPRLGSSQDRVRLLSWSDDAEQRIVANALYSHTDEPLDSIVTRVKQLPEEELANLFRATVGERRNRRHRPGREWEAAEYEFEIISDYGAFRDLQRHRMLTIDWQSLSPDLGYDIPAEVGKANVAGIWRDAVSRAESAYQAIVKDNPAQASYLVTMQHRIRYVMRMNAREAMHLIELRSSPQGHPSYRKVAQDMHAAIRDQAGHRLIADAIRFVNQDDVHLGRLQAEQELVARRAGRSA
jgi:thymidylate synthase ThyX